MRQLGDLIPRRTARDASQGQLSIRLRPSQTVSEDLKTAFLKKFKWPPSDCVWIHWILEIYTTRGYFENKLYEKQSRRKVLISRKANRVQERKGTVAYDHMSGLVRCLAMWAPKIVTTKINHSGRMGGIQVKMCEVGVQRIVKTPNSSPL